MVTDLFKPKVIQINHLEDRPASVEVLKSEIIPKLKENFPDYEIKYENQEDLESFEKELTINHKIDGYILDINLGPRSEKDGLRAYDKLIQRSELESFETPIFFTGYLAKYSNDIRRRQINSKYIVRKSGTPRDSEAILNILIEQFNRKIIKYNNLLEEYTPKSLILSSTRDLDTLNHYEKVFLAKSILQVAHSGHQLLVRDNNIWELRVDTVEEGNLSDEAEHSEHVFIQLINEETEILEGIAIKTPYGFIECFLLNLPAIRGFLKETEENQQTNSPLIETIIQTFLARRLAQIYSNWQALGKDVQEILELVQNLPQSHARIIFLTEIWENMTLNDTLDIPTTNNRLASLYKEDFPTVQDILYAQVVEHIQDDIVKIKVHSVDNIEDSFFKGIHVRELLEAGVSNVDACFKLYVFENGGQSLALLPGKTIYIEPITYRHFENITKPHSH